MEKEDEENGGVKSTSKSKDTCCSRLFCRSKTILVYLVPIGILGLVVAGGVTLYKSNRDVDVEKTSELIVIKSPNDNFQYRAIELSNKIKVILVSDPQTQKAAACLIVAAGFLNDPPQLGGMAHYLEHYLFMGTKKYPIDDQLSQFLSKNGGFSNAYTTDSSTGYYFDSSPQAFDDALDRFSQFFHTPLFPVEKLESVINAVDSEFSNTILNDYWRTDQVIRFLANSSHPYSRRQIGNKLTLLTRPTQLSIDVLNETLKFFHNHYSANLMTLSLISNQSLDQLQLMANQHFGKLTDRKVTPFRYPNSPLGSNQVQSRIDIVSLVESNRLDLIFPIPDYTEHYKSKVVQYITSLLGHEGPGSILSFLKNKKLATGLSASFEVPASGFSFVTINIYLTDEASAHIDHIILHVFQYIELMRQTGPQKWYWESLKTISETRFRFKENSNPVGLVKYLANSLQHFPPSDVWTANYFYLDFKPKLIEDLMKFLTPENILVVTISNQIAVNMTKQKEPTYGTEFNYRKIGSDVIQMWKNCGLKQEFKFPLENQFLPTQFQIKPRDVLHQNTGKPRISPRLIMKDKMSSIWFLQDTEFFVPKAFINLDIYNSYTRKSIGNRNLQNLLVDFVRGMIQESTYSANEAGLYYDIKSTPQGIQIVVQGYDHKIQVLLNYILKSLLNSTQLLGQYPDRFEIVKRDYLRHFENFKYHDPWSKAASHLFVLMNSHVHHGKEMYLNAKNLTSQDVIKFAQKIFSKVRLEWFIFGNMAEEEAFELNKKCVEQLVEKMNTESLSIFESQRFLRQTVKLPKASSYLYEMMDTRATESCVRLYLQIEPKELRQDKILLMFLNKILGMPCFNILRTKEQLGYHVACFATIDNGVPSFQFYIQGMNHPNYTLSRIHNFLENMAPTFENMTADEFDGYKASVRTGLKARKPKNLLERAYTIQGEMEHGTFDFEKEIEDLKLLESIQVGKVVEYFNMWINPTAQRRILSINLVSQNATKHPPEITNIGFKFMERIKNMTEWKDRLGYYEAPTTSIFA